MGSGLVDFAEVDFDEEGVFFFGAGFGKDFAGRAGYKTLAPELDTVAGDFFVADAVRYRHVAAIGHGVAALDGFPGVVLFLMLGFFGGMPADGGWVEKDFCALHCRQTRRFGIPLVPTDEDADFAVLGLPGAEAEVTGSEIKFFVIKRIIRDMHLAIEAEEGAVGIDDGGGIVINTRRALFEEGGNDDDAILFGEFLESFGGRAGDGFGEFEIFVVLGLAEVLGAEEFLGADDLSALFGDALSGGESFLQVGGRVGRAGVLDEADGDFVGRGHNAKKFGYCVGRVGRVRLVGLTPLSAAQGPGPGGEAQRCRPFRTAQPGPGRRVRGCICPWSRWSDHSRNDKCNAPNHRATRRL